MNNWPRKNTEPSTNAIRLRILIGHEVRHLSWIEPPRLRDAVSTIRSTFDKLCPDVRYTLVAERGNVSVLVVRT